ncbi:MAG: DUF2461 domain-containing protein [Leeuwenhoekiella sp.]
MLTAENFQFLKDLKQNNDREWMTENKTRYQANEKRLKAFYAKLGEELERVDVIEKQKVFRINRDIRFSKDKTPYNVHRSVYFSREGAHRRGGYYLRIEPARTYLAGGFFQPEREDLFRIRKEFELDAEPFRKILAQPKFNKAFGGLNTEDQVKTAPKGFSREDPNIDLIRNKNFFVSHKFEDYEVLRPDFHKQVVAQYQLMRPFFDYMSVVLTTDLNGESVLD